MDKIGKRQKLFENVRTLPDASECLPTHPNGSEWIRMGPNTSQNPRKLRKTYENCENFVKNCKTFRDRRIFFVNRFLPLPLRKRLKTVEKIGKCQKHFGNVRTLPDASERLPTHPNGSEWIQTGPNTSQNQRKLRKTCENRETFANNSKKITIVACALSLF